MEVKDLAIFVKCSILITFRKARYGAKLFVAAYPFLRDCPTRDSLAGFQNLRPQSFEIMSAVQML